jgi:hypothetical protein
MRRTSRPLVLLAAVSALALSACVAGAEAEGPLAAAPECDEHGIQISLTPTGEVAGRTFMAIGLVNCGEAPLVLDTQPQLSVPGGDGVIVPRAGYVPAGVTLAPGQGAVAPLSWTEATGGEVLDVDRFLLNALPVTAEYELVLAEPLQLDADHVLDLGVWQPTSPGGTDPVEPTEPATETPTAAPTETPTGTDCPEAGFRATVTQGSAAMGIRTAGIEIVNCGEEPIEVNGYPVVQVLVNGSPIDVEVTEGSDSLEDPGPTPITVAPGESVSAGMLWRNRVESADPADVVNADELNVGYAEGSPLVTVSPEATIDLGTTRDIEVTAWR